MSRRTRTALLVPALAAVTVLVLAACSGGDASAAPSATATDAGPQRLAQGGPGRGGASGEIASVTGAVMQLRSTDSQTAVTWTDTTTFTAEEAGSLADVSVGTCVLAVAAPSTDSGTAGSSDGSSAPDAPVAATTVRITPPADDGTCTPAFGGPTGRFGTGPRPEGAPSAAPRPSRPSGAPSGAAGRFRAFAGGASGTVTAIDGDTLTVQTAGPDGATTPRTVTVSSDTAYTRTVAADATAVVVGQCATARGAADDSGKVTATTVTVSAPTDGSCSSGFVFNGGAGPAGAGPGGSQTNLQESGTGA